MAKKTNTTNTVVKDQDAKMVLENPQKVMEAMEAYLNPEASIEDRVRAACALDGADEKNFKNILALMHAVQAEQAETAKAAAKNSSDGMAPNGERMNEIFSELEDKAKAYNDAYEYHEVDETARISKEMDDLVDEYNDLAEAEVLRLCRLAEKPLVEAAVRLKYATITYKDVALDKEDKGNTTRVVDWNSRYIDTQKLHKAEKNGVGEDSNWIYAVQRLNYLLTVRKAYNLGIPERDFNKISDCYAMKQEAKKIEGLLTNETATKSVIQADIDHIIKMMVGDEYSATPADVEYLESVYSRKSTRTKLTVAASNHSNMRNHMLDICHRAITGEYYSVDAKLSKKAVEKWESEH